MNKIIKDDVVVIIAGKDKGKKGKVLQVLKDKVIVEGVNLQKKHQKPVPAKNIDGGVLQKNGAIHISNVAIFNPETQKKDKIKINFVQDEKTKKVYKERCFKSNNAKVRG